MYVVCILRSYTLLHVVVLVSARTDVKCLVMCQYNVFVVVSMSDICGIVICIWFLFSFIFFVFYCCFCFFFSSRRRHTRCALVTGVQTCALPILTFGARFDRDVESRADPEATRNPDLPPRKIDMLSGELGYSYKLNRIGIGAQGGVQRQNYLAPDESDRDLTTWRGSVRVSAQLAAGRDVFLLGFVNRRDHRLSVDRSGLDRDATTLGFLPGAGLDIGTKWRGVIGVGLFRTNSDDPTLRSFSGFAANGKITWSPDERPAVTADVFRGNVATVPSGARTSGVEGNRVSESVNI